MKITLLSLAAIAAVASADAAVVSINLTNGDGPRQVKSGESTGVIDTTGWLNVSATTSNIGGTGIDIALSTGITSSNTARGAGGDGTSPVQALYEGGLRDSTGGTPGDTAVTLTNLAAFMTANGASDYRILAYYKSPVTSGTRSFSIRVGATPGSGTLKTTNTPTYSAVGVTDSFVELGNADNNWMQFAGLTSGTSVIEVNRVGRDGLLVGLQIEAVPEPSSAALLGLGGLALTRRRRR